MRSGSKNPFVQRLLGKTGNFAEKIRLSDAWAYNAIKAVGNYDEIWQRNLGKDGLGMARGVNKLWTKGGILIAPPFR